MVSEGTSSFYNQSYTIVKHTLANVVDDSSRCVKKGREMPAKKMKVRLASNCNRSTTKMLFDKPVQTLREGLKSVVSMGITHAA